MRNLVRFVMIVVVSVWMSAHNRAQAVLSPQLAWSVDGAALLVALPNGVWVLPADLSSATLLTPTIPTALVVIDETSFAIGTPDGAVQIMALTTSSLLETWQILPSDSATSVVSLDVVSSKSGTLIAAITSDHLLLVYDVGAQALLWSVPDAHIARFSPDGYDVACGQIELSVDVHDALKSKVRVGWALEPLGYTLISALAYSPTGGRLLIGGDSARVLALDVLEGNEGWAWATANSLVSSVDWSADDRWIAAASQSANSNTLQVMPAMLNSAVIWGIPEVAPITSLAFNPASDLLATITSDGLLRLRDVATGVERASYRFTP